MKPIALASERIVLRRAIEGDAQALFHNYCSNPESSRFLTRNPHTKVKQTATFLKDWCDLPWHEDKNNFAWVAALKNSNEAIGVFIVCMPEPFKAEIHFGIGCNFWRKGLSTEMCRIATEWLSSQRQIERIWTVCDMENLGCKRILENIGFVNEGVLRNWLRLPAFEDSLRDCYIYSKVK